MERKNLSPSPLAPIQSTRATYNTSALVTKWQYLSEHDPPHSILPVLFIFIFYYFLLF